MSWPTRRSSGGPERAGRRRRAPAALPSPPSGAVPESRLQQEVAGRPGLAPQRSTTAIAAAWLTFRAVLAPSVSDHRRDPVTSGPLAKPARRIPVSERLRRPRHAATSSGVGRRRPVPRGTTLALEARQDRSAVACRRRARRLRRRTARRRCTARARTATARNGSRTRRARPPGTPDSPPGASAPAARS